MKVFERCKMLAYFLYDSNHNKFTCNKWANDFRNDVKVNLILKKKINNSDSRNVYLYGYNMETKHSTVFFDGGGWMSRNLDKFHIGDTIIKQKGKYTIYIKRKDQVISIPFKCDKIYFDR
jgi:hypothetical protein